MTSATLNKYESQLWASITGQLHYGVQLWTKNIITYTVYNRLSGAVMNVREKMSRAAAIKSINDAKEHMQLDSTCIYHLNGDITINLFNNTISVVGFYKNVASL